MPFNCLYTHTRTQTPATGVDGPAEAHETSEQEHPMSSVCGIQKETAQPVRCLYTLLIYVAYIRCLYTLPTYVAYIRCLSAHLSAYIDR